MSTPVSTPRSTPRLKGNGRSASKVGMVSLIKTPEIRIVHIQWNLSATDTLRPATLSSIESLSSSQRLTIAMGKSPEGCPFAAFFRGSFIGGSTVNTGSSNVIFM